MVGETGLAGLEWEVLGGRVVLFWGRTYRQSL